MTLGFRKNAVALGILVGIATATVGCGDEVDPVVIEDEDGHRVFVTSGVYSGNLELVGNEDSPIENADYVCNVHASEEELDGLWKAWMSTQDRAAIDRIDDYGPWFLIDEEQRVADDVDELSATGPRTPINMREDGEIIDSRFEVWTGTKAGGQSADDTCADWSSLSELTFGQFGSAADADGDWTDADRGSCDESRRFYCFEQ